MGPCACCRWSPARLCDDCSGDASAIGVTDYTACTKTVTELMERGRQSTVRRYRRGSGSGVWDRGLAGQQCHLLRERQRRWSTQHTGSWHLVVWRK